MTIPHEQVKKMGIDLANFRANPLNQKAKGVIAGRDTQHMDIAH